MKDIIDLNSIKRLLENNEGIISVFRTKYRFQGDTHYQYLFDALLIFYDPELFSKLELKLSEFNRLKNGYFWYSKYISALNEQGFAVSDHEQARFKMMEEMDRLGTDTDWLFIKEIDELNRID